jgi:CSLREA domain-containing protein
MPRIVLTVNSSADGIDTSTGNGVCAAAGGLCTLRAAIMEANALGAAIIEIDSTRLINLVTGAANTDSADEGDLDITGAVILRGNGTQLQTDIADRFFDVQPGAMLILSDLWMIHDDQFLSLNGGCIRIRADSVFVGDGLVFNQCWASTGGAIGIEADRATVEVSNSVFLGNTAVNGGAIGVTSASDDGHLRVDSSEFSLNTATDGDGGAIRTTDYSLTVTNSTFQRNEAILEEIGGRGGAIFFESVSVNHKATLTHVTIVGNEAQTAGGGLYTQSNQSPLTMINSLMSDNSSFIGPDCAGSATSIALFLGTNLIGTTVGCPLVSAPTLSGSTDNTYRTVRTHPDHLMFMRPLRPTSPAIDAADATYCPATDQVGFPRPAGAGCDLGAAETLNLIRNGGFEQGCAATPWKISSTKDKVRAEVPFSGACALRMIGKASKATTPTVIKQVLKPQPGALRDGDVLTIIIPTRSLSQHVYKVRAQAVYSDGAKAILYDNEWILGSNTSYYVLTLPWDALDLQNGARTVTKIVLKISDKTTAGTWYLDDVSVLIGREK